MVSTAGDLTFNTTTIDSVFRTVPGRSGGRRVFGWLNHDDLALCGSCQHFRSTECRCEFQLYEPCADARVQLSSNVGLWRPDSQRSVACPVP